MQAKVTCLTVEGLERFATALKDLASLRRLIVTERLRRAPVVLSAEHGADCEDARFEPARVERRARNLETLSADAQCVTDRQSGDRVELGARVTLVELDSAEPQQSDRVVSSSEANPRCGPLSQESPTGRTLLGRPTGNDVTIQAPAGAFHVRVVAVS